MSFWDKFKIKPTLQEFIESKCKKEIPIDLKDAHTYPIFKIMFETPFENLDEQKQTLINELESKQKPTREQLEKILEIVKSNAKQY